MKSIKVLFQLFVVLTAVWFSSMGCVSRGPFETTKEVWNNEERGNDISYDEQIISFYNNKKGQEILFLGERYHYIFTEDTKELSELLKMRSFLNLFKNNFNIYAKIDATDNRLVSADIQVLIPDYGMQPKQRVWFANHKFIPIEQSYSSGVLYQKRFTIKGTRYQAKREINQRAAKLKEPIALRIEEWDYSDKNRLHQIAMTPLALVQDVASDVFVIGANILLSPLYLVIFLAQ